MKKMKGILALALALAMICSSLAALAEEAPAEEPAEEILTETAAEEAAVEEAPEEPVEEQAEEPVEAPALSGAAPAADGEELNGTADNGKETANIRIDIHFAVRCPQKDHISLLCRDPMDIVAGVGTGIKRHVQKLQDHEQDRKAQKRFPRFFKTAHK